MKFPAPILCTSGRRLSKNGLECAVFMQPLVWPQFSCSSYEKREAL